jgi:hypothetical protein
MTPAGEKVGLVGGDLSDRNRVIAEASGEVMFVGMAQAG